MRVQDEQDRKGKLNQLQDVGDTSNISSSPGSCGGEEPQQSATTGLHTYEACNVLFLEPEVLTHLKLILFIMSILSNMNTHTLIQTIIGCAYQVHNALEPGFLEKVYENALRLELEGAGLVVRQQVPIPVLYKGHVVGEYFADLLVDGHIIVEVKAVQSLAKEHEVQLVHYLSATRIEDGLLINFGASVQVKRKFRTYRASKEMPVSNNA